MLHAWCFSSKFSTTAIKRGTLNEPAVVNSLEKFDSINYVFNNCMLSMKKNHT